MKNTAKQTKLPWFSLTTLGQEMRWAFSTMLPRPHGVVQLTTTEKNKWNQTCGICIFFEKLPYITHTYLRQVVLFRYLQRSWDIYMGLSLRVWNSSEVF